MKVCYGDPSGNKPEIQHMRPSWIESEQLSDRMSLSAENLIIRMPNGPFSPNLLTRIHQTSRTRVTFMIRQELFIKIRSVESILIWLKGLKISSKQILTLLTTEELLKTVPRELITPRTFSLQPYQTLFVGGIGRIDVIHSRQNVILTVFTSNYLPIHVVYTQEARRFYDFYLGSEMLGVPFGNKERLDLWPELKPVEVDLNGISWEESCGDLVLSSAGWVSVTIGRDESCVLKASTPGGRGMFIRKPSLLPYAIQMKGRRIPGTPCYETSLVTVDDVIGDDGYSRRALEERRRRNYALESYQLRERNKN